MCPLICLQQIPPFSLFSSNLFSHSFLFPLRHTVENPKEIRQMGNLWQRQMVLLVLCALNTARTQRAYSERTAEIRSFCRSLARSLSRYLARARSLSLGDSNSKYWPVTHMLSRVHVRDTISMACAMHLRLCVCVYNVCVCVCVCARARAGCVFARGVCLCVCFWCVCLFFVAPRRLLI